MSERKDLILNWLHAKCYKKKPIKPVELQLLAGDASLRKYYRIYIDDKSYVVMDAMGDPSLTMFIKIACQLKQLDLNVPELYEVDENENIILMSDLGDELYLHQLNLCTADKLYGVAIDALIKIQQEMPTEDLPIIDANYIIKNLKVFKEWFLGKHLNLNITPDIQDLLKYLEKLFYNIFINQTQVFVHLDYHSRNLLVLKNNTPGIIDFQDAMIGPILYDVVSLWQDAYISWTRSKVEQWLAEYQNRIFSLGLINEKNLRDFIKIFDLIGLQRHLKNLGVFSRLYYRDNKPQYLDDIPMLLKYITNTCSKYEELKQVKLFFNEQIRSLLCVQ